MLKNRLLSRPEHLALFILMLLLCAHVDLAYADDFGRFMTTATERQQLDKLRDADPGRLVDAEASARQRNALAEVAPSVVTVRGLVYRGQGKSTAWINSSKTYEGDAAPSPASLSRVSVQADKISIADRIELKVGQTFDLETGQLQDLTDRANQPALDGEHTVLNE